jgi:hypothetical protein
MNALASISYAPVEGFPVGSVVDHIVVTITGANTPAQTQNVAPGTGVVDFANVPADSYGFSVAAVDAAGNTFGTAVTGTFTITAPQTVTLSLPSAVTIWEWLHRHHHHTVTLMLPHRVHIFVEII